MDLSHYDILKYVLGKLKTINGKKALQKIMYFINEELKLSYHYKWWAYGPFSKELYDELDFFILLGYVRYDPTNFLVTATEKLDIKEIVLEENVKKMIDDIIRKLEEYTGLEPRKLELLASLYFLRNSYSGIIDPNDPNELFITLNLLKKNKFSKEEVLNAISYIEKFEETLKNY